MKRIVRRYAIWNSSFDVWVVNFDLKPVLFDSYDEACAQADVLGPNYVVMIYPADFLED